MSMCVFLWIFDVIVYANVDKNAHAHVNGSVRINVHVHAHGPDVLMLIFEWLLMLCCWR